MIRYSVDGLLRSRTITALAIDGTGHWRGFTDADRTNHDDVPHPSRIQCIHSSPVNTLCSGSIGGEF